MVTALPRMGIFCIVFGLLSLLVAQDSKAANIETVCQGIMLSLDCPRNSLIEILSANYGRTHKKICNPNNKAIQETNCISKTSKNIIMKKCNKRRHCSIMTRNKDMGGDPCPGVLKYVDVIYRCVRNPNPVITFTPLPTRQPISDKGSDIPFTTTPYVEIITRATARIVDPNTTLETDAVLRKHGGGGFFRSMLLLVALVKDKPKHSLLSVLTGVAAGTVVILVTVLACVCVKKRRDKKSDGDFNESGTKKAEVVEVEKSELLGGKTGRNSDSNQSARSDDHVDSAFGDDETYRTKSDEIEMSNNMAYLDNYIQDNNQDNSLPRQSSRGSLRMTRRAHNDGSKGRSYDYNSNNDDPTTFRL